MPVTAPPDRRLITGVILAGGKARRMGGEDKGLLAVAGRPLAGWALTLLAPQVGRVLLNANRNQARYAALGAEVIGDRLADFQGPLAGIAAGLAAADSELVTCIPCDSPLLPGDLIARLWRALDAHQADIAVAHDGQRMQPVCVLLRRDLLGSLQQTLATGERRVDRWYARHRTALADLSDRPDAFLNANTPQQLAALEQHLSAANEDPPQNQAHQHAQ